MSSEFFNEAIEFAIEEERKAAELYEKTAENAGNSEIVPILQDMAKMERGHEKKLKAFKEGKLKNIGKTVVQDLKIGDYMVDVELTDSSSIQDVLIFSIKSEAKANELYTFLANALSDPAEKEIFLQLANEESKHKFDLEKVYDDKMYSEN